MKKLIFTSTLFTLLSCVHAQVMLTNDIYPGSDGSAPFGLQELNGKLYFNANDGVNGNELWKYDANGNTAQLVFNIGPGSTSGLSYPMIFVVREEESYVLNGKLYFMANDQTNGSELWVYDGVNSPYLLADINPGAGSSYPRYFTSLNNKLYFSAASASVGVELFMYDPATNVAQVISDINPGIADAHPSKKVVMGNKIYFVATSATTSYEMYVYNPPNNTTTLVNEINPGNISSQIDGLVVVGGKIYFYAYTATFGRELYSYAGSGVPDRLTDLAPGNANGVANTTIIGFNGKVYFSGTNGSNGNELYAFDPLSLTADIVYDIESGAGSSEPNSFYIYSGKMFFSAATSLNGRELWSSDGINSPAMVEDINPGPASSFPSDFKAMGNRLYFNATNGFDGNELFYYQDPYFSVTEYNNNINTTAYPVPAADNVNIRITLEETASFSVNVYDITGKTVYTLPTADYTTGTTEINIPLQTLSKGSYQYSLVGSKGLMGTGKIIKQ